MRRAATGAYNKGNLLRPLSYGHPAVPAPPQLLNLIRDQPLRGRQKGKIMGTPVSPEFSDYPEREAIRKLADEQRVPSVEDINRVMTYMEAKACVSEGHAPTDHFATLGDHVGFWTCECRAVRWEPKTNG